MSAWQPISTAPKDGTMVLLLEPKELTGRTRYGRVSAGLWAPNRLYAAKGFWSDDSGAGFAHPSHWMPLPNLPVIGCAEGASLEPAVTLPSEAPKQKHQTCQLGDSGGRRDG